MSWRRTLDVFEIPYVAQSRGDLADVSRAAGDLLGSLPGGHDVLRQAAQLCMDALDHALEVPSGGVTALREVPAMSGVHLIRVHLVGQLPAMAVALILPRKAGFQPPELAGFTPREHQVADLIAHGRSNKEVASALGISAHTARHHTERVFSKLGVQTRAAVAAALAAGRMGSSSHSEAAAARAS